MSIRTQPRTAAHGGSELTKGKVRRYWLCLGVDSFGYGSYLPLSLLYFHRVTGMSLSRAGFILSAAALIAVVANPLGGTLVDRYGPRSVLVGGYLLRAAGFCAYSLVTGQAGIFLTTVVVAFGAITFQPAIQAFVVEIARGQNRDRMIAAQRSIRNAALGGGALVASFIISLRSLAAYHAIVLIAGGAFLAAALLAAGLPTRRTEAEQPAAERPAAGRAGAGGAADGSAGRGGYLAVIRNRPFFLLTMATFPVALGYMVPSVIIPVYLTQVLHAPASWAGMLYAVNTAGVALLQMPVTRLLIRYRRTRSCALGQLVFALAFGTFGAAIALPPGTAALAALFCGIILFTAAELLHSATTYALTASAAPDKLRGRHLAFYQFSWEIPRAAAPAVLTVLLATSPAGMWVLLAAGVVASAMFLLRLESRLPAAAVHPRVAALAAQSAGSDR